MPPIHPLSFEDPKETFGDGMIGTTAHGGHAADLVRRQEVLVLLRRELTAAIGMENDWRAARPVATPP